MVATLGHLLISYIASLSPPFWASQKRDFICAAVKAALSFVLCRLFPRMLLAPVDLEPFNDMVTPFEVEAYDILKYRSRAYDQPRGVPQPRRDTPVFHFRMLSCLCSCPAM